MATHEGFVHVQDPSMPPAGASVTKGWIFVDEDGDTEPAGTRSGIQLRDESAGRDDPAPGGEAEPAEDQNAAPAEDLPPKDQDTATPDPNGQPTPSDEEVTEGCGATIISAHVDAMLLACTEAAAKTGCCLHLTRAGTRHPRLTTPECSAFARPVPHAPEGEPFARTERHCTAAGAPPAPPPRSPPA